MPISTQQIQESLDGLTAKMLAKGLIMPESRLWLHSGSEPCVTLSWNKRDVGGRYVSDNNISHYFRGADIADRLAAAAALIDGMPDKTARDTAEFMERLAETIEHGKKIGVDAAFVNPLVDAMKRLSENAITYQAAA